jgi:hypothetical protein
LAGATFFAAAFAAGADSVADGFLAGAFLAEAAFCAGAGFLAGAAFFVATPVEAAALAGAFFAGAFAVEPAAAFLVVPRDAGAVLVPAGFFGAVVPPAPRAEVAFFVVVPADFFVTIRWAYLSGRANR